MMNKFLPGLLVVFLICTNTLWAQNSTDPLKNLALETDATVSSSIPAGTGRGAPGHVLYDPVQGNYAIASGYAENGVSFGVNLGTPSQGQGYNWQVEWTSPKNINYITFGGTYPNQPQPNTEWVISYFNGATKITLDQGTGGWIDSGTYEWGGTEQSPIYTTKILLEVFSNGTDDLLSIHIRGRGGSSNHIDTSAEPVKACLIQYLPSNNTDTQAPTAPTVTGTSQIATEVDLLWSVASDNIGVTDYLVYQGSSLKDTLNNSTTTYTVTGLTASTTYQFSVIALDAAGNESTGGNAITVTTAASSDGSGGNVTWTKSGSNVSMESTSDNLAIGRSTVPDGYKLAVEGSIRTREVRVDQDSWPDYVFKEGYNLPSLSEIQKHIREKGHLPKVPSANEVEMNGIELGEMNRLLLEKIEELTLYIINQEKRIQILEKNR